MIQLSVVQCNVLLAASSWLVTECHIELRWADDLWVSSGNSEWIATVKVVETQHNSGLQDVMLHP